MCDENKCCKKTKKKKSRKKACKIFSLKIRNGDKKIDISVSTTPFIVLSVFLGLCLLMKQKRKTGSMANKFSAESTVGQLIVAPFGAVTVGRENGGYLE